MQHKIPPPVVLLFFGGVMWLIAKSPVALAVDPGWISSLAWPMVLLGVSIDLLAAIGFHRAATTINPLRPDKSTALVTGGVYRVSRNPMYLGLLLILVGWGIRLGSITNLLLIAAFVVAITELQIKPEEQALRRIFGEDYVAYCRRVRRWV